MIHSKFLGIIINGSLKWDDYKYTQIREFTVLLLQQEVSCNKNVFKRVLAKTSSGFDHKQDFLLLIAHPQDT